MESRTPLVSVCLPVYNGERYLAQAVESILAQSLRDFELVVADDASTDASWQMLQDYAARDARIKLSRNENNLGLFENYNHVLRLSSGQYLKLFAQDDMLEPRALEKMVSCLENHDQVVLVSCAKRWIGPSGDLLKSLVVFPEDTIVRGQEAILYNLMRLTNWIGEPSTVMFRRQCAGSGFDSEFHHYGDIEYWFRILEHGDLYYLSDVQCSFRRHGESCTTKNLAGLYFALDLFRLGRKYRAVLEQMGESEGQFRSRAIETAALTVDHLVRVEGLDIHSALEKSTCEISDAALLDNEVLQQELVQFKALSFMALEYITKVLFELNDLKCRNSVEIERLERQIEALHNSSSWKLTAPLRDITRALNF